MMDLSDDHHDDKDTHKAHRGMFASAIQWVESIKLPTALSRRINSSSSSQQNGAFLITGLERVFYGTQPAADVVTICGGIRPPRYLCYMVSGFVCDIIQFLIDVLLHLVFHLKDASLCWALGFGISVSFRHTTHRYLVFGDYVGGYWASLGRMYTGYSIIIVLSTIFNFVMTHYAQLPHYVAWIITLLWTGIVNYFILKKLWTFGGTTTGKQQQQQPKVDTEKDAIIVNTTSASTTGTDNEFSLLESNNNNNNIDSKQSPSLKTRVVTRV